jgi:hypothetical protein
MFDAIQLELNLRADSFGTQVLVGHLAGDHLAVILDERLACSCQQWVGYLQLAGRQKDQAFLSDQAP